MQIKPFPQLANICPVAIPFPNNSHLISANIYAVGKRSVTLIDTGPKLPGIFSLLEKQLTRAGIKMTSIERILVTHGHIDHFGLAVKIQKAAGHPVEFLIHSDDSWKLSNENLRAQMWSPEADNFMAMAGVPEEAIETAKNRFILLKTMCDPLDTVSTMATKLREMAINLKLSTHPDIRPDRAVFTSPDKKYCSAETISSNISHPIRWWS